MPMRATSAMTKSTLPRRSQVSTKKQENIAQKGLFVTNPSGAYSPAPGSLVVREAMRLLERKLREGPLTSPAKVKPYLRCHFQGRECEYFTVVFLDNRHRLIAIEDLFRGTIDGAAVHPREVVKDALRHNAAAVIFAHNHPSGVAEPGHADRAITIRLRDALGLIDVRVLDHFVVGNTDVFSFSEKGLI